MENAGPASYRQQAIVLGYRPRGSAGDTSSYDPTYRARQKELSIHYGYEPNPLKNSTIAIGAFGLLSALGWLFFRYLL
jgi:hypothetical protein